MHGRIPGLALFIHVGPRRFARFPARQEFLRRLLLWPFLLGLALALVPPLLHAKKEHSEAALAPRYRNWLDVDVKYIITRDERRNFLELKTDADRDKFMKDFWEVRNPTPGSPINSYKEEYYSRIAYANEHFGSGKRVPGWTTPRGRIYILLGAPAQKEVFYSPERTWPIEVWFYSTSNPALPPYFYLLFYDQDNVGDFKLYSPYFDGPTKLINERGMTTQDALKMVYREGGAHLERLALTLLPDEPVNFNQPQPTMDSDELLSTLQDLANHPFNREEIAQRWLQLGIQARLILPGQTMGVLAVPLRDSSGAIRVHYLLRLSHPQDFAIGRDPEGRYYYSIEERIRVFGLDKKLIFTDTHSVKNTLTADQVDSLKDKVFGYEGWLPLPPGKYHLELLLTNWVKNAAFQATDDVTVPDLPQSGLQVSGIVPFESVERSDPESSAWVPFSIAGLKFTPLLLRELDLPPSRHLNFFYQVWAPPADPRSYAGKALEVDYAYGRPGIRADIKTIQGQAKEDQFDANGSLVDGKRLSLAEMPPGSYLLTLTVHDPSNQHSSYATMPFRIVPGVQSAAVWDVYDTQVTEEIRAGLPDYERALCYLALGEKEQARNWLLRSLKRNPARPDALTKLVDLDYASQNFAEIASVAEQVSITAKTDELTLLRMAESLAKTGQTPKAIALLESAISVRTPSAPVYLALASYYQSVGDARKAQEMKQRGKALQPSPSPSS
jgi:GWxTD domain-containing protein